MNATYDLLIIGAGPGGYVAAKKAAALGMSVAVIDSRKVGGTCINRGCIPTKALIHASSLYREMLECEKFGLMADNIGFDLQKIYAYKDASANVMHEDLLNEFEQLKITSITGTAQIQANKVVRIILAKDGSEQYICGKRILIATGAKANMIDIPGSELPGVMTSEEILTSNEHLYKKLLILGGGVIGLELATVFNALGTEVTIIEAADRLLSNMDLEFSDALEDILTQRGVRIYKDSTLEKITNENNLSCHFIQEGKSKVETVNSVLVSIGRSANTKDLFHPEISIKMNQGKVVVNEFFMTSMPGVYAIGDVIGGVQLAHVASAQATYVVERMNELEPSVILSIVPSCLFVPISIIPSCVYTDPEISSVGLTQEEARRKGVPVRCGKYKMSTNGQSVIAKEKQGFIKVVFAADSDVLLGAQLMCSRATDMIGELATAIANGLTSRQLMYAMRAQPTFNEAISNAVENSRVQVSRW